MKTPHLPLHATTLLLVLLSGCATAPTPPLRDANLSLCEELRRDRHVVWHKESRTVRPDAWRVHALAALRRRLGVRVTAKVLQLDDVARFGGTAPLASAGYGDRTLIVGATLERMGAQADEVKVSMLRPEVDPKTWREPAHLERETWALFGVPTYDFGRPSERPLVQLPLAPFAHVTRRSGSSLWSGLGNVVLVWSHMLTLGIFLLPRLGESMSGSRAESQLGSNDAQFTAANAWAATPGNLAGSRWLRELAPFGCAASTAAPCRTFALVDRVNADVPTPRRATVRMWWEFSGGATWPRCTFEDEVEVDLASIEAPSTEIPDTARAEVWVLPEAELQQLVGVPPPQSPEAFVATCRVEGAVCSLRVETRDGVWEAASGEAADLFINPGLRHEAMMELPLTELVTKRLEAVIRGGWSVVRRVPDTMAVTDERVTVSWWHEKHRRVATAPLAPGATMRERLAATFPGSSTPPEVLEASRFLEACREDAPCTAPGSTIENACRWGVVSACRRAAMLEPGRPRRLERLRQVCALGDGLSCAEFARDDAPMSYEGQGLRSQALLLACGAGVPGACNQLAWLIGHLAEREPEQADRRGSLGYMRQLLERGCAAKESASCENLQRLPTKLEGRLDALLAPD